MRNQVTTLHENPPNEVASRVQEETQNVPLGEVENRPAAFSGFTCERIDQKSGRPIRRILVPTNFSLWSARAIERAIALARQSAASLTILHVIDINPPAASRHYGTADDLMRQLWLRGTSELARLKKSIEQTQVRIQTLLVEGLPYEAIVENSSGFDLLIISEPNSRSGWNFFFKQTARRVIEQAKCPVHVVRQEPGLASLDLPSKTAVAA
jgi:nucleotide-binding universal stress UspA family protein